LTPIILRDEFNIVLDAYYKALLKSRNTSGISSCVKWWARRKPLAARIFYASAVSETPKEVYELVSHRATKRAKVLDPFMGGGTFVLEPATIGAEATGIEISKMAVLNAKVATALYNDISLLDKVRSRGIDRDLNRNMLNIAQPDVDRIKAIVHSEISRDVDHVEKEPLDYAFILEAIDLDEHTWACLNCGKNALEVTINDAIDGNICRNCGKSRKATKMIPYTVSSSIESCVVAVLEERDGVQSWNPNPYAIRNRMLFHGASYLGFDANSYSNALYRSIEALKIRRGGPQDQALRAGAENIYDLYPPIVWTSICSTLQLCLFPSYREHNIDKIIKAGLMRVANRSSHMSDYNIQRRSSNYAVKGGNLVYWLPDIRCIPDMGEVFNEYLDHIENIFRSAKRASDRLEVNVLCGDSRIVLANHLDTHKEAYDIVMTDPPYYNALSYSGLSLAFSWIVDEDFSTYNSVEASSGDVEEFSNNIGNIFRLASDAMKDDGIFMFTFHHEKIDAIEAIMKALSIANLEIERVWIYPGESSKGVSLNENTTRGILDMLIVCRKKGHREDARSKTKQEVIDEVREFAQTRKVVALKDMLTIAHGLYLDGVKDPEMFDRNALEEIIEAAVGFLYSDPEQLGMDI